MGDPLDRVALFAGLGAAALDDLRGMAQPFALLAGELLFRQGDPPSGLYVVGSGLLEIASRMPGDDTARIDAIAPGEVVGEFALLDDGPRSANVRAVEATSGLFLPARHFAALLEDGRPGAVSAIDRLRTLVATRTRATLERLAATSVAEPAELRAAPRAGQPYAAALDPEQLRSLGFDELAQPLLAAGEGLMLERGNGLGPGEALYLVVRGAVRAGFARGDRREQLIVHGPGEWAGLIAAIDGGPQPLALEACEDALLLRVDAPVFSQWRTAPDVLGRAVLAATDRQLVRGQRRANRHLGRAIALERFNAVGKAA